MKEINKISGICRDYIGNPFVTDACLNVIASNDDSLRVYKIPSDFILSYDCSISPKMSKCHSINFSTIP